MPEIASLHINTFPFTNSAPALAMTEKNPHHPFYRFRAFARNDRERRDPEAHRFFARQKAAGSE